MPKERRQRQERATRMIYGDKSRIGNDIERLLPAIVGMRTPTNVREEARGMSQTAFFMCLVEPGGAHEAIRPDNHLLRMRWGAGAKHVELARCRKKGILLARPLVEHGIEQPLAHAQRRDHHLLRARDTHD